LGRLQLLSLAMESPAKVQKVMDNPKLPRLVSAILESPTVLIVAWVAKGQDQSVRFPAVFLRDNCTCPKCLHPVTRQRKYEVSLPLKAAMSSASVEGNAVRVGFEDGCVSDYDLNFLFTHAPTQLGATVVQHRCIAGEVRAWSARDMNAAGGPGEVDFQKFLDEPDMTAAALDILLRDGLVILTNAGVETGTVRKLESAIGKLRPSQYGGEIADICNHGESNPDSQAFTSNWLPLHTDLPSVASPPDIGVLHCIVQSNLGGENIFSDGEYVAQVFMDKYPNYYKLLTETLVHFSDDGRQRKGKGETLSSFFFECWHATLERQASHTFGCSSKSFRHRVSFNHGNRGTMVPQSLSAESAWPSEERRLEAFFEALSAFGEMLHSSEAKITYKLDPGSIVLWDNRRVLHGRNSFSKSKPALATSGKPQHSRHLQGAYLNFDDVFSQLRILRAPPVH